MNKFHPEASGSIAHIKKLFTTSQEKILNFPEIVILRKNTLNLPDLN